jgi:hypothetical protein
MKPRLLVAGALALATFSLIPASASEPTEIVLLSSPYLQAGIDNTVQAQVREVGGGGIAPATLTFTLGPIVKSASTAPAVPPASPSPTVNVKLKPTTLGPVSMLVEFAGNATSDASSATFPMQVWEYVIADETGVGDLLLSPTRGEMRIATGDYDSGILSPQLTAAGPAIAINFDGPDANGNRLVFAGAFVTTRGSLVSAGLAGTTPIALAHR